MSNGPDLLTTNRHLDLRAEGTLALLRDSYADRSGITVALRTRRPILGRTQL